MKHISFINAIVHIQGTFITCTACVCRRNEKITFHYWRRKPFCWLVQWTVRVMREYMHQCALFYSTHAGRINTYYVRTLRIYYTFYGILRNTRVGKYSCDIRTLMKMTLQYERLSFVTVETTLKWTLPEPSQQACRVIHQHILCIDNPLKAYLVCHSRQKYSCVLFGNWPSPSCYSCNLTLKIPA